MPSSEWGVLDSGVEEQSTSPRGTNRPETGTAPPSTEQRNATSGKHSNFLVPTATVAPQSSTYSILPRGLVVGVDGDGSGGVGGARASHCSSSANSNGASTDDLVEHAHVNCAVGEGDGDRRNALQAEGEGTRCRTACCPTTNETHPYPGLSGGGGSGGERWWNTSVHSDDAHAAAVAGDGGDAHGHGRVMPNPHTASPASMVCVPTRLLQRQWGISGAIVVEDNGRTSPADSPHTAATSAASASAATRGGALSIRIIPPTAAAAGTTETCVVDGVHRGQSGTPVSAEGDGKDHLTPVRCAGCRVRRYSGVFWSHNGRPALTRRPSFSSVPTPALSPPSSIPPMNVSPQSVVDHFHDAYRGSTTPTLSPQSAGSRGVGGGGSAFAGDGGNSASYPPSTAGTRFEESSTHPMPLADVCGHCASSEEDSDADTPPLLSVTRRQSARAIATTTETDHDDDDENDVDAHLKDVAHGAAPFFLVAAEKTPCRLYSGEAPTSPPLFSSAAQWRDLMSREAPLAAVAGGGSSSSDSPLSPPEASDPLVSRLSSPPQRWFVDDHDGRATVAGAAAAATSTTASAPLALAPHSPPETSPLGEGYESLPTSPPLGGAGTPPGWSSSGRGCRPSSLPRRPPRALFSNLSSPPQQSLAEAAAATATRVNVPASPPISASGATDKAQAAATPPVPLRGEEGESAGDHGVRFSPTPTSLPTSPEDLDLAELVQRHVSQRIAQNYAQSCSYYLHYHAKPGPVLGASLGCGASSYPSSPEECKWDDAEDADVETVAASETVCEALRLPPSEAVQRATACESTSDTTATTTTTTTTASSATKASGDAHLQQPLRRRFSCAVPRMTPM